VTSELSAGQWISRVCCARALVQAPPMKKSGTRLLSVAGALTLQRVSLRVKGMLRCRDVRSTPGLGRERLVLP
jgi:hypothetical protein